jgi:hypothetical protein
MRLNRVVPVEFGFLDVEFDLFLTSDLDKQETGSQDEIEILSIKIENGKDELVDVLTNTSLYTTIEEYLYDTIDETAYDLEDFEIERD